MSAPRVLTPIDADYPALLAATPLPPTLWVCGALLDGDGLAIGIVGPRRTAPYGAAGAAADFGREVFAVPGRITSETSRGPHELLRDGATLVRSWIDVVSELPLPWRNAVRDASSVMDAPMPHAPTTDEAAVLAALTVDEPQQIEHVIARCGLAPSRVGATLVSLELAGRVRQLEG